MKKNPPLKHRITRLRDLQYKAKKMGLLLPYLITKHLQEWFFIFVLKSLARTAQRYEFPRKIISGNKICPHAELFLEYPKISKPTTISDNSQYLNNTFTKT